MGSYLPEALDKYLKEKGKPVPENMEDILDLLPPQRKYIGPGAWYDLLEPKSEGKK